MVMKAKLWSKISLLKIPLTNIFLLDPTVLFGNPYVYYLEKNKQLIACAAVVPRKRGYELKMVYTHKQYRNKGKMTTLLNNIHRAEPILSLICKASLAPFYKRFGYQPTRKVTSELVWRSRIYNRAISRFTKKRR
jgi:N-acetylglutamate synthase-like GNAT family acetyltransferase